MRYEKDKRPRCWLHKDWVAIEQVEYDYKMVWACATCLEFIRGERSTGYQCKYCHIPVVGENDPTPVHKLHTNGCPRDHDYVNVNSYRAYG